MSQRELASSMAVKNTINADDYAAPVNGASVDVTDGDAQTIVFDFGGVVDAAAEFKIQEFDGSSWNDLTPVQKPELNTKLYGQPYPAAGTISTNAVFRYAYVGSEDTIRGVLVASGASTKVACYVIAEHLYERANLVGFLA